MLYLADRKGQNPVALVAAQLLAMPVSAGADLVLVELVVPTVAHLDLGPEQAVLLAGTGCLAVLQSFQVPEALQNLGREHQTVGQVLDTAELAGQILGYREQLAAEVVHSLARLSELVEAVQGNLDFELDLHKAMRVAVVETAVL